MPTADVGAVRMFYLEKGTGQPIVFVHGIPTDHRAWSGQLEAFSPEYRVVTYSRRYAAPNTRTGDLLDSTVENNVKDLVGLLARLKIPSAHVVGHSYGGFIAAYLAAFHPELVRSLVLVEPAVSTLLVKDPNSAASLLGLLLRSPSVALSGNRFLKKGVEAALKAFDAGNAAEAARLNLDGVEDREGVLRGFPQVVRAMMKENARTIREVRAPVPRFTREDAGRIRCPTLVLGGGSSPVWLRRIADLMAASVPRSKRLSLSGAAHFPHLENAPAFNAALARFLRDQR